MTHMCLTLCILESNIFFIHVLILFPTEVFTTRHILFSFYRYANQCACPRDEETAQAHSATNGPRNVLLVYSVVVLVSLQPHGL